MTDLYCGVDDRLFTALRALIGVLLCVMCIATPFALLAFWRVLWAIGGMWR